MTLIVQRICVNNAEIIPVSSFAYDLQPEVVILDPIGPSSTTNYENPWIRNGMSIVAETLQPAFRSLPALSFHGPEGNVAASDSRRHCKPARRHPFIRAKPRNLLFKAHESIWPLFVMAFAASRMGFNKVLMFQGSRHSRVSGSYYT